MGLLFLILPILAVPASAAPKEITLGPDGKPITPSTRKEKVDSVTTSKTESIFESRTGSLSTSHFTWGAEAGSSIDMTGHDLSTFDVDVVLGYKNPFFKLIGIGAGIHHSVRGGNSFIPVYGVIRTSFTKRPSLLFMNLQAGYSFNTISNANTIGDFSGALGLGVNLSQARRAKSYVIASCGYQYFSTTHKDVIEIDAHYLIYAKLVIGVNF